MKKKYVLKCSQCGRRFLDESRGEALSRLRKHLWKEHKDWMSRRIKAGIRKSKKARGILVTASPLDLRKTVQNILNPPWVGFAEKPIIEKLTGKPYAEVKEAVLDAIVRQALEPLIKLKK
ncbi:hypothetical protein ES705_44390 [subsurface metagenome]